ncbi:MAG: acyl-CoA dehydrogenase family protein, partial [Caldimonas sp.]
MSDSDLAAPFDRLLGDVCPPAVVRAIERGGTTGELWSAIEDSGFLDTLVPEVNGGAGLRLTDAFVLFAIEGRHALPVPAAHTMLARALLAAHGVEPPRGAIAIAAEARAGADGGVSCPQTPYGLVADAVVVALGDGWRVLPTASAVRHPSGVHGSLRADLHWPAPPSGAIAGPHP